MRVGGKDTVAVTSLDIPNVAVSAAERDEEIARIQKALAQYATNDFDKSKIATTKPGIAAVTVDEDGRLWVQHNTTYRVKSTVFDVFDNRGKHLERITLPVKQSSYLPIRARGDALWFTAIDDDDVPSIVRYRIQR